MKDPLQSSESIFVDIFIVLVWSILNQLFHTVSGDNYLAALRLGIFILGEYGMVNSLLSGLGSYPYQGYSAVLIGKTLQLDKFTSRY